ncbi:uncharacterized protein NEMAJ01_2100, partial [Nematocida major]|uniref:uncharacterized protein n=1 Tax=Nematocida major TaxID=1912982 RepID=UPI0020072310
MHFPAIRSTRDTVASIIEVYCRDRNIVLSKDRKKALVEYLLPYTKLSLYIPSTHEIKTLSRAALCPESHCKVEKLLLKSTPEVRKAVYFLFKLKETSGAAAESECAVDPEETALGAVKNASIGVYMSWFREIADGKGRLLKKKILPGLFDIAHEVCAAGEAYASLNALCSKHSKACENVFYEALREELGAYRNAIYSEPVDSLFSFYVKHAGKMKWLHRMLHLAQEVSSLPENCGPQIVQFAEKMKASPWTQELAQKILRAYKVPLSDSLVKWMQGERTESLFIQEEAVLWGTPALGESEIPVCIPAGSARRIVYAGRVKRLLHLLGDRGALCLEDAPSEGVFDEKWVLEVYERAKEHVKLRLFSEFGVHRHFKMIRDVFFLFRSDFARELLDAVEGEEISPGVVDEVLARCFGEEVAQFVDVC